MSESSGGPASQQHVLRLRPSKLSPGLVGTIADSSLASPDPAPLVAADVTERPKIWNQIR